MTGFVAYDENRAALLKLLRYLGFRNVQDRIEVLPSKKLGPKRFGFVNVAHTFNFDKPLGRREVVTDCLLGTSLYLLKEAADDLFRLRIKAQTERLETPSELRRRRRLIARIKTIQTERGRAAGSTEQNAEQA